MVLNYLAGKNMDFVNKSAMNGTILAHTDGQVPNLMINVPKQDEFSSRRAVLFLRVCSGVSGYMLGVNPFNQPGVESYKRNMFALLGKPGYEKEREELIKKTVIEKNRRVRQGCLVVPFFKKRENYEDCFSRKRFSGQ